MPHLKEVSFAFKTHPNIDDYAKITPEIRNEIARTSLRVEGTPVIHINATPVGGGVAELLQSQIPLERSLGIESHWLVLDDIPAAFFDITKKMHNFLQGKEGELTQKEKKLYLDVNKKLSAPLLLYLKKFEHPLIIVHDPQPLGMIQDARLPKKQMALRLHIDLSTPNESFLNFFRPLIEQYPRLVLSAREYVPNFRWYGQDHIDIIAPAIDPLNEKNRPMEQDEAWRILEEFGLDSSKPLLTQVSRFDPWKDPVGVIEAFREIQKFSPDAQLALAGFATAKDDPEAQTFVEKTEAARNGDTNIFLFSDPKVLGTISNETFINALVRGSSVVFQKSIREGFGLTCTEALWKNKAVISGNTVGGRMQIVHKEGGFIVNSPLEAAEAARILLNDIPKREKMGKAAHETARKNFMITRYILDHLKLYNKFLSAGHPKKETLTHAPSLNSSLV